MADTKTKKLRIYKYAAEINLSAEQLLEFLLKKGHDVKTIQSPLSDDMIVDITNHYKKDIEKTEKHNKKIAEFNKKRTPEKPKEEVVDQEEVTKEVESIPIEEESIAAPVEKEVQEVLEAEETKPAEVEPVIEKKAEIVSEIHEEKEIVPETKEVKETPIVEKVIVEEKVEEKIVEKIPEPPVAKVEEVKEKPELKVEEVKTETEKVTEVKQAIETTAVKVDEPAEKIEEKEVVIKEDTAVKENKVVDKSVEKVNTFVSPKDYEVKKRRGLTVLGKMDLSEKRKKETKPENKQEGHKDFKKGFKKFDKNRKPDDKRFERKPEDKKPEDKKPEDKRHEDKRNFDKRKIDVLSNLKPKQPAATTTPALTTEDKKKKLKVKKKGDTGDDSIVVKKKKKVKKFEIDQKEVKETIRKTMMNLDESAIQDRASLRKKRRKEREEKEEKLQEQKDLEAKKIAVTEFIAVNELANLMNVPVADVISKCISMGLMVSINQRLDIDSITLVADEFGIEVEFQKEYTSDILEDIPDKAETLLARPPVVTIMGHVDHGKTSLLDYIRNTNVVAGESGGITQHIGAYRVNIGNNKYITFLDTPGHEAFTAMRARGASITDIVVLVVAADDAVMPQTVEAINHAQAASVPIVIAMNKIDKPGANIEKIKQQLAERNILVEDWGGKYQCIEISAKTGVNIDILLEKILLEADLLDLKANPNRDARGVVVESELDKGRGITGTILVQKGTLKIGDSFVAGVHNGKVRAMFDERGNKVIEAPPSTPVLVLGFEGAPQAGDTFVVVESERQARDVSIKRQQLKREQDQKQIHHITLDEIAKQISIGGVKELPLIVKGDVDGSVEAISDSLMKLSNEEVKVNVIHKGVGGISEGDVLLAAASEAIIIGFHVRPNLNARKLAENQKVDIRLYNVIYDIINEIKSALEGLLSPVLTEEVMGTLEIRNTFRVPKFGNVAGCQVLEGKIIRNSKIRLIRDGIVILEGEIGTLKRFKDDVKEVDAGYECGLNIANFNDIKIGDIIEAYKIVETKKKLI